MTAEEKNNIKRLLRNWGSYSKAIKAQSAEIAEFKKVCRDIELAQPNNEPCQVISIDKLKSHARKLGNNLNNHMALKTELDEIIGCMSYDMQAVLRARYIKGINWDLMPINLPFYISERQCYRLHSQAIDIIYSRLDYANLNNPISC